MQTVKRVFLFLLSLKTVITFLSSLNRLVFIMDTDGVPWELGPEFLCSYRMSAGRAAAVQHVVNCVGTLSHLLERFSTQELTFYPAGLQ
jgi:hypothetical protein